MSCPICKSEFCDGEKCSENGNEDPYEGNDPCCGTCGHQVAECTCGQEDDS